MTSYEPIAAVLRGLEVLRSLNDHGPMAIGDLHKVTQISKPTLVRIIETLQFAGYVGPADQHRRYAVTAMVLTLGNGYRGEKHLMAVAEPILNAFREKIGWPSVMGVFDHDGMMVLDVGDDGRGFRFINGRPGYRLPLLRTAMGRAYLAMMPDEEIEMLLERLRRKKGSDFDAARNSGKLWQLVRQIRRRGYAFSDRETLHTVRSIGAAVIQGKKPVAAVNVVVLASEMSLKAMEARFAAGLMNVVRSISAALNRGDGNEVRTPPRTQ